MTVTMKATSSKRNWRTLGFEATEAKKAVRQCDHPQCAAEGEYRAPRSRDQLNSYYWFCLDHVRAYNAAWDYYKGMSVDEIEAEVRGNTTWQRPTWPLGAKTGNRRFNFEIKDPFGVFEEEQDEVRRAKTRPLSPEEDAVRILELDKGDEPLTLPRLKARYKELVKLHHPDANNGDKGAEERFKRINQAYHILKASLSA